MTEAPSNKWRVNQAALRWLKEVDPEMDENSSYLAQLAFWGLENGLEVPRPLAPNQPYRHDLELAVSVRLRSGSKEAGHASRWFLSNPNLSFEEQAGNLALQLEEAKDPLEAAWAVIDAAYDRMVAASATYPD